jgi:hypothetical protein
MLANEAAWLEAELAQIPSERLDPLLSIGSGTRHARTVLQPWIEEGVYSPLTRRGIRVIHHEYEAADGVDIPGDLLAPDVAASLRGCGARSVLCCNVLEHVADRAPAIGLLSDLVGPDGYLLLTVPRRFPFHPDPIDTMYRPSVEELRGEFPCFELVSGAEVRCGTLLGYLRDSGSLRQSLVNGLKVSLSRRDRVRDQPRSAGTLRYLVRATAVTCVVLRRPSAESGV